MNTTETTFISTVNSTPENQQKFIRFYVDFLSKIVLRHGIMAGARKLIIDFPKDRRSEILEELRPLMGDACLKFLKTKVTPEFLEAIHNNHQGNAKKGKRYSVRTTLQYMLVNQLDKNTSRKLIVSKKNGCINLTLNDPMDSEVWIHPSGSRENDDSSAWRQYDKIELRELLRRFRIMLTRLAGNGDLALYPTPYECYCLYHNCSDRKKIVSEYVSDKNEQEKFLNRQDWDDATVGKLLACKYQGKRQIRNNRRVVCGRKTVSDRRREYQELLAECLRRYLPKIGDKEISGEEIRILLHSRSVEEDKLLLYVGEFCRQLTEEKGYEHPAQDIKQLMKTRTMEQR